MEGFQLVFLLLSVISGLGMLFASYRGNRELRDISVKYVDDDKQRLEKKWEGIARWVPIRKQILILFAIFLTVAVGFYPVIMLLVLKAQMYQLRKKLITFCGNSLYLEKKKQHEKKVRENEKYAKEENHKFSALVWDAVSPVYYQKDNFHYPIEIQLMNEKHYAFN